MRMRYDLGKSVEAFEAIAFQGDTLTEALAERVNYIRKNRLYNKTGIEDADIAGTITKGTNLNVSIEAVQHEEMNAAVMPPIIDRNHPFYNEFLRSISVDQKEFTKTTMGIVAKAGGLVAGSVDRKNGKVTGIFKKWKIPVYLTTGLIQDLDYTDREVAAVILHELGHVITYFEYMGLVATANFMLAGTVSRCLGADDYQSRATIIAETADELNVKINVQKLAEIEDKELLSESISTVMLSALIEESWSSSDTNIYDVRTWEQMADQFAVRHGAGRDLATALDKRGRKQGFDAYLPMPTFLALEALKFSAMAVANIAAILAAPIMPLTLLLPIGLLAIFVGIDQNAKVYDDPGQRMATIRRQMTEELKLKNLTPKRRKAILEDLDLVMNIEKTMDDKRGWFETLSTFLIPWHRGSYKKEQTQKKLEELVNNKLFITAAKLKSQGA